MTRLAALIVTRLAFAVVPRPLFYDALRLRIDFNRTHQYFSDHAGDNRLVSIHSVRERSCYRTMNLACELVISFVRLRCLPRFCSTPICNQRPRTQVSHRYQRCHRVI